MKVLVLGHHGLLGNSVARLFLTQAGFSVYTTEKRWPHYEFIEFVRTGKFDWIVNCIAKIPQSKCSDLDYYTTNLALPVFLSTLESKVIHASTNQLNEETAYNLSKLSAEQVLLNYHNTFIIRCSIIGIEVKDNKSLLSWFLTLDQPLVDGYLNHFWNGITTLEWSKICLSIINQEISDKYIIPFSDTVSKYELLELFKEVFSKNIVIRPVMHSVTVSETKETTYYVSSLKCQLEDLKQFYKM